MIYDPQNIKILPSQKKQVHRHVVVKCRLKVKQDGIWG